MLGRTNKRVGKRKQDLDMTFVLSFFISNSFDLD